MIDFRIIFNDFIKLNLQSTKRVTKFLKKAELNLTLTEEQESVLMCLQKDCLSICNDLFYLRENPINDVWKNKEKRLSKFASDMFYKEKEFEFDEETLDFYQTLPYERYDYSIKNLCECIKYALFYAIVYDNEEAPRFNSYLRKCDVCSRFFISKRNDAHLCSGTCRTAKSNSRKSKLINKE